MSKKGKEGKCRICGVLEKLSFEHVPPKSAFNKKPVPLAKGFELMQTIKTHDYENIKTTISQRGAGSYTLCERCNNTTGRWYGSAYADWTWQGASILKFTDGNPTLYCQYRIFPLRIIKQIICMFFSTNPPEFRDNFPYLEKFVLNPEEKYLNPEIKIFCYYNPSYVARQSGIAHLLNISGSFKTFSEISYFPFGYLMYLKSESFHKDLLDISFFARYSYNDWKEFSLKIPSYEIYTWYPGDLRGRKEILELTKKIKNKKNS